MKTLILNKKGQSLVETMVAMTIIMIVLSAAIVTMLNTKNLLYESQIETNAEVLVQEGLDNARIQRDIGCEFSGLTPDTPGGSDYHVIEGDLGVNDANGYPSPNIIKYTSGTFNISGFPGFQRKIYIYDLANSFYDAAANNWLITSQSFNSCASPDVDCRGDYYLIRVVVSGYPPGKPTQFRDLYEASTIISKKADWVR